MSTVRYWNHEENRWASGESIWNGKALPMDNSGWRQKEALLGGGDFGQGEYLRQSDIKGKANADTSRWRAPRLNKPIPPRNRYCACGRVKNLSRPTCWHCIKQRLKAKRERICTCAPGGEYHAAACMYAHTRMRKPIPVLPFDSGEAA